MGPKAVPTTYWNVPYGHNVTFAGRKQTLADLRKHFMTGETSTAIQIITGIGGIGKTQVAAEYAHLYRKEYSFVFWLHAEVAVTLDSEYANIARFLQLPEQNHPNHRAKIEAVKRWFENHSNWLIVF